MIAVWVSRTHVARHWQAASVLVFEVEFVSSFDLPGRSTAAASPHIEDWPLEAKWESALEKYLPGAAVGPVQCQCSDRH